MRYFLFLLFCQPVFAQTLDNEVKDITHLSFQQFKEVSRIHIETTDRVKYQLLHPEPLQYVVVIENARIPNANNRRFLDTQFFDSPIARIEPEVMDDLSPTVKIIITLKKSTKIMPQQQKNHLALDFKR